MSKKKEYVRMNPDVKALWVDALRSGKYQQTTGVLRNEDLDHNDNSINTSFCCLGVLCNLHAEAHPEIAAAQHDSCVYLGADTCLPATVAEWAGLPVVSNNLGPVVTINGDYDTLANHNDNHRSFKQIAHAINIQL